MNKQGKCYKCGGFLAVNDAEDAILCPFCGKAIIVEKAISSYSEAAEPVRAEQPKSSGTERDFVVERGVLVGCNCFTEANISIPFGVKVIGDAAFQGMNNIETVAIPAGVELIGSSAFSGCKNLRTVKIPEGVETIDRDVFNGCSSLKTVHFPDSLVRLEAGALAGCTSLETVEIPARVAALPWRVFEGCTRLRAVVIPKKVETIEDYAFADCTALEEVRFECLHPESDASAGVKRIGMNAFRNCTGLRRINIPETVEYIGNQAFRGCENIKTLVIPRSVKAIYPLAFADCMSLESVTFAGDTMLYKGSNPYKYGNNVSTFFNCPKLLQVTYSDLQRHFWAFPAYMKSHESGYMATGRCRHCGGTFKGNVCTICSNPKDY